MHEFVHTYSVRLNVRWPLLRASYTSFSFTTDVPSPVVDTQSSFQNEDQFKTLNITVADIFRLIQRGVLKPRVRPLVPLPSPTPRSATRFFRFSDQITSTGKQIRLQYAKTSKSANYRISGLKSAVLGFDMEWRTDSPCGVNLIQICDERNIILIHISEMSAFHNDVTNRSGISTSAENSP